METEVEQMKLLKRIAEDVEYIKTALSEPDWENWSKGISSAEVGRYDKRPQERGMDFGILIAANGMAGAPILLVSALQIIATVLKE